MEWILRAVFIAVALVGSTVSQNACRTPNRREGRCIPRADCRSFNEYFSPDRLLNQDELNFIQLSQCSVSPPMICCPDRAPPTQVTAAPPTTARPPVTRPTTSGSVLPDPKNFDCGLYFLADRIFGGEDTALEEFPWFALLEYITKKGERAFQCGGTLINRRYVLTAAHCLDNAKLDDGERFVGIRLGEHNTATEIDCEEDDRVTICADPPQNFGYERVILHPGYSKSDRNQHDDIALIRLDRDAALNNYVGPICLPGSDFVPTMPQKNVTIAGFGHTGRRRHSGVKQKAMVPIVEQGKCRDKWARIALGDGQLCAGGHFNIDSCSGDSGGPLMSQQLFWTIEGIVSFGNKCGLEGWPGVYTRVQHYVDWIRSVVAA